MARRARTTTGTWSAVIAEESLRLVVAARPPEPSERPRVEAMRIVTYLMLVRTVLATVLMLSVVILAWIMGAPENLASPFGRFVFGLLATTYLPAWPTPSAFAAYRIRCVSRTSRSAWT